MKVLIVLLSTFLLMGTSCSKIGPYYSWGYKISNCPPTSVTYPQAIKKKGISRIFPETYVACKNAKVYRGSKGQPVFIKISTENHSCNISMAFPTSGEGSANKFVVAGRKMKSSERFKRSISIGEEVLSRLDGVKIIKGSFFENIGKSGEEGIEYWCNNHSYL